VYEVAQKRSDAEFELVDIKDFNLPLLEEPVPAIRGNTVSLTPKRGPTCSIALAEQWFKAGQVAPSSPRSRKSLTQANWRR
jgi:hypothetical protein